MSKLQRRWSPEEDAVLRREAQLQLAASNGEVKNWNEIAQKIPGRSNKDCRKRFYNEVTGGLRKGLWTTEEDELLRTYIECYGQSWALIAQKIKTRSSDQCSKRWQHCLDPKLDRSSWSEEDNRLLIAAVNTHGTAWKEIQAHHFPGRSANNVKNQYTVLKRKPISFIVDLPPCCSKDQEPDTDQSEPHITTSASLVPEFEFADFSDLDTEFSQNFGSFDIITPINTEYQTSDMDTPDLSIDHASTSSASGLMTPYSGVIPSTSNYPLDIEKFRQSTHAQALITTRSSDLRSRDTQVAPFALEQTMADTDPMLLNHNQHQQHDHIDLELHLSGIPSYQAADGSNPFDFHVEDKANQSLALDGLIPTNRSLKASLNLNSVSPETLSAVMSLLIKSKTKVQLDIE